MRNVAVDGAGADPQLLRRLGALKMRTLGTALSALVLGYFGARGLAAPLAQICAWLYALALGQGRLPAPHVPAPATVELLAWLPQTAFLLVAVLSIIGFSRGLFGRLPARIVAIPSILVGVAAVWVAPATSEWLSVVPNQIERDILHGRFDAAEKALAETHLHAVARAYVSAQIALRSHDAQGLRQHGEIVLRASDRWAYGLAMPMDEARVVVGLRPDVLLAVDRAINGSPLSEVGLRRQAENAERHLPPWLTVSAQALAALLALSASAGLLWLWNLMRRHVQAVQLRLLATESIRRPVELPASPRAADATKTSSSTVIDGVMLPVPQPPVDSGTRSGSHEPQVAAAGKAPALKRRVGIKGLVLGLAAAGLAIAGLRAQMAAHSTARPAAGPDIRPCELVGVWMASRERSVYRITLQADGSYQAEPLARGNTAGRVERGTWVVRGRSIEWMDSVPRGLPPDVNEILDANRDSFRLKEIDGSFTRYNRAEGSEPVPSCAR